MTIAILGGSFDPPHLGHVIVAHQIKEYLKVDEVWLMPVFSHPFDKHLSPIHDRLAMAKLLENDFIKVSELEIKRKEKSYTIKTLELLTKNNPDDTFIWCIGSDALAYFHKWNEWKRLVTKCNIAVYPRGCILSDLEKEVLRAFRFEQVPKNIVVLSDPDVIVTNISSSIVRNLVKEGKTIEHLLPSAIVTYINKHHLFI